MLIWLANIVHLISGGVAKRGGVIKGNQRGVQLDSTAWYLRQKLTCLLLARIFFRLHDLRTSSSTDFFSLNPATKLLLNLSLRLSYGHILTLCVSVFSQQLKKYIWTWRQTITKLWSTKRSRYSKGYYNRWVFRVSVLSRASCSYFLQLVISLPRPKVFFCWQMLLSIKPQWNLTLALMLWDFLRYYPVLDIRL